MRITLKNTLIDYHLTYKWLSGLKESLTYYAKKSCK
jgi:hypothetical protein